MVNGLFEVAVRKTRHTAQWGHKMIVTPTPKNAISEDWQIQQKYILHA
jgi:hypothetical protein